MATKKLFPGLIFLLFAMTLFSLQCKKRFGCADTVYNFEIGVKAYPDIDSITVGDTIWMEVNTSDVLKDVSTNKIIDYSKTENLGSVVSFQQLYNDSFNVKALKKFKQMLVKGQEAVSTMDPDLFKEYLFDDINGLYQFKLGIVPLDTGVFRILFSNAANVYRKSDRCAKASFTINFEKTNQHYYLYPEFQGSPNDKSGIYYFKVK
ncbi:MAG: hypothetical protein ABIN25_09670 [Ginsengibacter sp.]